MDHRQVSPTGESNRERFVVAEEDGAHRAFIPGPRPVDRGMRRTAGGKNPRPRQMITHPPWMHRQKQFAEHLSSIRQRVS